MSIKELSIQREKFKGWRWTQIETAKALGVDRATIAVMLQECGWIAEDINCSRDDALIALGQLMSRGLIAT